VGIRCADHATLYPQRLALNSPTSGGRSVGIVRLRTKATEFSFLGYRQDVIGGEYSGGQTGEASSVAGSTNPRASFCGL
jgi:hypothetical protein